MATSIGRNDPCPCGSGKKYKLCCLDSRQNTVSTSSIQQQLQQALQLAHAHAQRGNLSQASTVCQQVLRHIRNQPDAHHLLGVIALRDGNIELATDHFQRAIKARPGHPEYLSNLGFAYHEQGDLESAANVYEQALRIDPSHAAALYNQHALLIETHPEQARKNLKALLQRHSADNEAHYMQGVFLDYLGDTETAQNSLNRLSHGSPLDKARLDAWNYLKSANNPLPQITGSMIGTFRLALKAAPPEGLVLEFGVRHGNTIRQIARLTAQQIHGFDSFEGLPEVWHHEPKGSYTTKGEIPKVPANVQLHAGWFEDTLPKFLAEHPGPVRFINVDCDIYSSTKTVLDQLAPRIVAGSVIVFDEYIGNEHWREDEFKAFQEAVTKYGWDYEYLCFSAFTKQVAVRIKKV